MSKCGCSSTPVCGQPLPNCASFSQDACCPTFPGVTIIDAWDVPLNGASIQVTAKGNLNLPIGAYLWSTDIGYFEITAVNVNGEGGVTVFTLQNNGTAGNAAPGTEVVAYTSFIATPPPA